MESDLVVEPAGHLPWLWGTTFLLAMVFSCFWLIKAFISGQPKLAYHLGKVSSTVKLAIPCSISGLSRSCSRSKPPPGQHVSKAQDIGWSSTAAAAKQVQPVVFEWCDMGCSVSVAGNNKTILQGVWGTALPRQLHGLLGPSGAGKSTLLDLLTLRLQNGNCTGQLLINKQPVAQQQLASIRVYVPQRDSLVPVMTARESVEFAAALKLPKGTPKAVLQERVGHVLQLMGLDEQQDMLVGGPLPGGLVLPGMSGSERKQLHIACGVVAGANLVFLDEPTSGLDACSALNVMLFLKGMATQQGATLLASIHQPRSVIWSQLDQVTLLASGRLMYTGPTERLVPWFHSLGYTYDPEVQGTTPDWALDLVSLGFEKNALPHTQHQHVHCGGQHNAHHHTAQHAQHMQLHGHVLHQQQHVNLKDVGSLRDADGTAADSGAAAGYCHDASVTHPDSCSVASTSSSLSVIYALHHPHDNAADGSLMTAHEQLAAAADAFKEHFQQQRPDLFSIIAKPSKTAQPQLAGAAAAAAVAADCADAAMLVAAYGSGTAVPPGAGSLAKYKALLWREWLVTTRNPLDVGARMLTYAVLGLLWGLITYDLPGDASSIFSRMMVSYISTALLFILPYVSMSLFAGDKGLFVEDVKGRLYHPLQYFLAKLTVSLPYNALLCTVLQVEFYGLAGMRHGAQVNAQAWLISVLIGLVAMQSLYFFAIIASSQDLAFVFAVLWTCPNVFVDPFMQRTYQLGWGVTWMRYLSPAGFAWQALLQLEMAGRGFDCSKDVGLRSIGLVPELIPESSPTLALLKRKLRNMGPGCVASGDAIVAMYSAQDMQYIAYVFILLGYFAMMLALTYMAVWRLGRRQA